MNNPNAPENLRVKVSTFQTDLSFNEWAEQFNVGSAYVEPTKYFQANPMKIQEQPQETFVDTMIRLLLIKK